MHYHRIDAWHPRKPAITFAPRRTAPRPCSATSASLPGPLFSGSSRDGGWVPTARWPNASLTERPTAAAFPSGAARDPAKQPSLLALLERSRWAMWIACIAIVLAWLLPGTLGHDPWKQDETYTFGIIQHMLESGDVVVPMNAGQPFVEKPPLYDWVAAGLAWMFGRYLPLHDAARLASALFAALTLACAVRVTRRATGATSWLDLRVLGAAALFAGSLVVVKHAHDMMTDVALMAGAALGFCGLYELVDASLRADTRADTRPAARAGAHSADTRDADLAALMFGAGVGIALMTKGLFVPLVFGATTCAVLIAYPACRSRAFGRSLALAALACAPFALIWPLCFFLRSEALFKVWFWDNNVGRFFGFSVPELGSGNDSHLFAVRSLMTVGFPVSPLALVALIAALAPARSRADFWCRLSAPQVLLPTLFAGIGVAVLEMSATVRELYVLPFIAPLAVLAVLGVPRLPQRLHTAWDLVSRVLFGVLVVLAWVIWATVTQPVSKHAPLHVLGRWLPLDWVMPIHPVLIVAALALTIGWLWLLPTLRHAGIWRGALSWCLGAIVAWGLVSTLLLPWLDIAKSYRSVFDDLSRHLAVDWNDGDCMASIDLGESEAPMLYYFTGVLHQPILNAADTACTWLIVGGRRDDAKSPGDGWRLYWSGARPGDTDELLRVFVRTPDGTPPMP